MDDTRRLDGKTVQDILAAFRSLPTPRLLSFREIAGRTGASPRNLRCVLEHELLGKGVFASWDKPGAGHGVPRQFSIFTSFVLSLAALMLEAGIRSGLVRKAIVSLLDWASAHVSFPRAPGLAAFMVFTWSRGVLIEIGDGANVRIEVDADKLAEMGTRPPSPMGWRDIETGKKVDTPYAPLVALRLDLGRLKEALD